MSDIGLNPEWNLNIVNGDLSLTSGLESVRQNLNQRLRAFLQEWFLDQRIGIPYFEQILVRKPNPLLAGNIFKAAIINAPGVIELLSFDLSIDSATRVASLTFSALTTDGVIDFSEVVP